MHEVRAVLRAVVEPVQAGVVEQVRHRREREAREDVAQLALQVDHGHGRTGAVVTSPRVRAGLWILRVPVDGAPAELRAVPAGLRGDREDVVPEARATPRGEHPVADPILLRVGPVVGDVAGPHLGVGDVLAGCLHDRAVLVAEPIHLTAVIRLVEGRVRVRNILGHRVVGGRHRERVDGARRRLAVAPRGGRLVQVVARIGERPEVVVEAPVLLGDEDDVLDRRSGRPRGAHRASAGGGVRPGTAIAAMPSIRTVTAARVAPDRNFPFRRTPTPPNDPSAAEPSGCEVRAYPPRVGFLRPRRGA